MKPLQFIRGLSIYFDFQQPDFRIDQSLAHVILAVDWLPRKLKPRLILKVKECANLLNGVKMSDVILAIIVRKLVVARRKSIVISNVCKNDDESTGRKYI